MIKTDPETDMDVVQINDYLTFFYSGRYADHAEFDMRLGGGCYVIHRDSRAIVVDTFGLPGQGEWVKDFMIATYGTEKFTVVNTHWHGDHVGGNHLYQDDTIVGHSLTRDIMLQQADNPKMRTPPNLTFEGRMDLWLDDLKIELHEFKIHALGHVAVYLPDDKILLAADMLEDPICIFNFDDMTSEVQLREFERMKAMEIDCLLTSHCNIEVIKAGGYDKWFIENMADYMCAMVSDGGSSNFGKKPAQDYIAKTLKDGDLTWWGPYEEVHAMNVEAVRRAL